jgi:hypothetical protein
VLSVTAVRAAPVSTLFAETVTFGIMAPLESRTVPNIVPLTTCASIVGAQNNKISPTANNAKTLNCCMAISHRLKA